MPSYDFDCSTCGTAKSVFREMRHAGDPCLCDRCARPMTRVWRAPEIKVFKPYTEDNLPGGPVHFETAAQRDAALDKHGCTYDSTRYHRRPQYRPAAQQVTLDEVHAAVERGEIAAPEVED